MHPMFIVTPFTITKIKKQPKFPVTDERLKEMQYIHTMEYYSTIIKMEILPYTTA